MDSCALNVQTFLFGTQILPPDLGYIAIDIIEWGLKLENKLCGQGWKMRTNAMLCYCASQAGWRVHKAVNYWLKSACTVKEVESNLYPHYLVYIIYISDLYVYQMLAHKLPVAYTSIIWAWWITLHEIISHHLLWQGVCGLRGCVRSGTRKLPNNDRFEVLTENLSEETTHVCMWPCRQHAWKLWQLVRSLDRGHECGFLCIVCLEIARNVKQPQKGTTWNFQWQYVEVAASRSIHCLPWPVTPGWRLKETPGGDSQIENPC